MIIIYRIINIIKHFWTMFLNLLKQKFQKQLYFKSLKADSNKNIYKLVWVFMHMCVFWFFSSKRTRDMYKLHIMFHNYKIHPSFLWKIPSPQKVDFNLVEKLNLEKNYKTANNKDKICNSNVFRFFQYEHPIFTSFFF